MKPVIQTITEDKFGNCFAACLASLLELPISEVPDFRRMQEEKPCVCMVTEADKWLREKFKLRLISIDMYQQDGGAPNTAQCLLNRLWFCNTHDFVILSGESPRKAKDGSKKYHCVIGIADCWGFKIVHDPHPDGGGIIGQPYGVKWIVSAAKESPANARNERAERESD
jgi:hypothetical protein